MDKVPVLCLQASVGCEATACLRRAGVLADMHEIRPGVPIPEALVYVVADGDDFTASRAWSRQVPPSGLARSITLTSGLSDAGLSTLAGMGIRHACAAPTDVPDAIGRVAPYVAAAARDRLRLAAAAAATVLDAARSATAALSADHPFDGGICENASLHHVQRGAGASLFLMLETFALEGEPTVRHCAAVAVTACALARELGLAPQEQALAFVAGVLHDVGKWALPRSLVEKPTKLDDDEMRLMRTHVTAGHEALRRHSRIPAVIADAALLHHEYLDGTGYPGGLAGGEIPRLVRIVTIADIFSALVERRSYKDPIPAEEAYGMLRDMGAKLDPELVTAFRPVALSAAAPA